MKIVTKDVYYVGVNDHEIDLFEGQYIVPNGMAYNSYVIVDEESAVIDSVDQNFADEWLANVKDVLKEKLPNYMIVQHMEPDHSGSLMRFLNEYPDTVVVGNAKTFKMFEQFFGCLPKNTKVVNDNELLKVGKHQLTFVFAPMVHWPEVMLTYDSYEKILFSADAFGKFGALDVEEEWACEARRYYIGIVGKYGSQVVSLLKKASMLEIDKICPLHGPILEENLGYYINLYSIWANYQTESEGIVIAYTSVYGNTKKAVLELEKLLTDMGCPKVVVNDLARCDMTEAVEDAFRYGTIVLATTTYNNDVFPFMKEFINHLTERNFSNKKIGLIENGSWAPTTNKVMKQMFEKSKNLIFAENEVKILSALNEESKKTLALLAKELCE